MKRILLLCIIAVTALSLFAQQYSGFYRIKNNGAAGRYVSIQNDKVSNDSKNINWTSGYSVKTEVDALQLIKEKDKDSDPGTVLYISGSNNGLTFEAQGLNTKSLIKSLGQGELNLLRGSNGELYTSYSGHPIYMLDFGFDYPTTYNGRVCCGVATSSWINKELNTEEKTYIRWTFKKIDNANEYFGIKPTEGIQIGDKYYTTLFTTFAYQLPEGMKAFYIGRYDFDRQDPIAELKEITNGKIPASTPVIIECSSNDATNNKVTLYDTLSGNLNSITGNKLKGNVFCFIPEGNEGQELKHVLEFDQSTMRVLGKLANGELGLVADNDKALKVKSGTKYIPANKAYLSINKKWATATANGIKILQTSDYDVAASISKVKANEQAKQGIYTLTGVKVKEDNNTNDLPSGIYIIDGKKQVIR